MTEKVCCPHCKEHVMHQVYFEKGEIGLRCMNCDLVVRDNTETVSKGLMPP